MTAVNSNRSKSPDPSRHSPLLAITLPIVFGIIENFILREPPSSHSSSELIVVTTVFNASDEVRSLPPAYSSCSQASEAIPDPIRLQLGCPKWTYTDGTAVPVWILAHSHWLQWSWRSASRKRI